jgi:hypothetical protein
MVSVETKNIRQDLNPERGEENIESPIISTGKKVAINKWLKSGQEGNYANLYLWPKNIGKRI